MRFGYVFLYRVCVKCREVITRILHWRCRTCALKVCAYKHRHTVTSFVGLRAYDLEFAASAALGLGALALALDLLRRSCARARAPSPRAASLLTLDLSMPSRDYSRKTGSRAKLSSPSYFRNLRPTHSNCAPTIYTMQQNK